MAQSVKGLPAMRETWVRSLGLERSPGEGNGNLLQHSCLENSMDRGAWWATAHGVTKNRTRLSDYIKEGLIVPCTSPCSTPIFTVKTLNGKGWRLV